MMARYATDFRVPSRLTGSARDRLDDADRPTWGCPMRLLFRGSYRVLLTTAGVLLGLVPITLFVSAQQTLPPIQFNVPYRCADGTTYIIQRCETGRKAEVCFYRI